MSFDVSHLPNDEDFSLVLKLEHNEVFKLKDTDRTVPGQILGLVYLYILSGASDYILEQVKLGYKRAKYNWSRRVSASC